MLRPAAVPPTIAPTPRLAPAEATRRWAACLPQIFEVEPLACQPSRDRRSRRPFAGYAADFE